MGTTSTQLATGGGRFGFVLAIEGFQYLITDAADTTAVATAWAATEWDDVISGLRVLGGIKQEITPFKDDVDMPSLRFEIMDVDGNDTVGRAIWKSKPSIVSRLSQTFEPAPDGSGTVTVHRASDFASSGTIYIGTQTLSYSSKTGSTQINVPAAGTNTFSPFAADTGLTYGWPQTVTAGVDGRVSLPPKVTDVPQTWIGKNVALYIHRIVDGVWDTRAQAHLEFAGKIQHVEDASPGVTAITCVDLRKEIAETVIMRNQWRGYIKEGIRLIAGQTFYAKEHVNGTATVRTNNDFTVVASGASGSAQMNEGYYALDEFYSKLSNWLSNDSNLNATWFVKRQAQEDSFRTHISATFSTAATQKISFHSSSRETLRFMGFEEKYADDGTVYVNTDVDYEEVREVVSERPPYRVKPFQGQGYRTDYSDAGYVVDLESSEGSVADLTAYLGESIGGVQAGGGTWIVIKIKTAFFYAKVVSATQLSSIMPFFFGAKLPEDADKIDNIGITFDEPEDRLVASQVAVMMGKFSELVPRLIASIDGNAVNHTDYDAFPWGAAIPWSLLGDTFVNSCKSLEQSAGSDSLSIFVDRPTPLWDIIGPELALRFAFLVFVDGGYRFVSPPTPNALTADYTLTEANKAVPSGDQVPPSTQEWTSEHVVNVVRVNYNRNAENDYTKHIIAEDRDAIYLTKGKSRTVVIDAVNSYNTETAPEYLTAQIVTRIFPMFSKPIKVVRRTISPDLYGITPGASVSLSDDLVRDPASGQRGLTSRGCICLSSFHDYGHEGGKMYGEVTLLLTDEDRTYPLSPAAEIDTTYSTGGYTNGYDSGANRFKLKQHAYSKSTDSTDVNHFDASDTVTIMELDPADPSSPTSWTRTIGSVNTGADTASLTSGISSPSWDGTTTKRYVIYAQPYTSTQASQKLHAFQASGTTDIIQTTAEPNLYADWETAAEFTGAASAVNPGLIATAAYGDGQPLTPFHLRSLIQMGNNLLQYKTAVHVPYAVTTPFESASTVYQVVNVFPLLCGTFRRSGRTRSIKVAPTFRVTTSGTASVRVTISASPPSGSSLTAPKFTGTVRIAEWSTTSTAYSEGTVTSLAPVINDDRYTWVTVELKTTANNCRFRGLSTLYMDAET